MHFAWQAQYKRHVHQRCWEVSAMISERDCILEHRIFRFAEMILRDRCSTSYDLASPAKIAKRIGTRPSALHPPFIFEEVSQNCFVFHVDMLVFDVVKFKICGCLAELRCFGCCQVQKLRKSRRIASFSSLQIDSQIDR